MPNSKDQIYGEWFMSTPPVKPKHADRILGARILHDAEGRPEWVDLQYHSSDDGRFHQIQMDFVNAVFVLSCLKSMQLDSGIPFPDDPRAPR